MKFLYLFIIFFLPTCLFAQDFNYVHYDTKDGLAGSTVYSTCQDKDGFMWFATENGLSRYDGTHFKNFTVTDGLPDNEVLVVFTDTKGRVWIGTFSKEICYYYNGKIHNQKNDTLLAKMKFDANIESMGEDVQGFLGISCRSTIIVLTPSDRVINYKTADINKEKNQGGSVYYSAATGKLQVGYGGYKAFGFNNKKLSWNEVSDPKIKHIGSPIISKVNATTIAFSYDSTENLFTELVVPGKILSTEQNGKYANFVNTTDGSWLIDSTNGNLVRHYLANKKISHAIEDKEKNIWFTTLGEGVFKLVSEKVETIAFAGNTKNNGQEIFSIIEYNNAILAGSEFSKAILVDKDFKVKKLDYSNQQQFTKNNLIANRLYSMERISNSIALLGFDGFLVKLENSIPRFYNIFPLKSIGKIDDEFILIGTSFFAFKMRVKDLQIVDTIWRERCTKVFYQNKKYYIGTLQGLYQVNEDKSYTYLGNLNYALTRRITDIKIAADNTLWIATSDNGMVAFKDGKVTRTITDSNGLSSNICKAIFINDNSLWVGTDKGINKIDIKNDKSAIIKYTTSDGLPSNTINALYIKDSIVWVGSPQGLTYFKESSIFNSSMCNLKMLSVYVSGKEVKINAPLQLSYQNNNINFQYVGVSFKSGGEITYYYKLTDLDKEWNTTIQNNLDYKSLAAGDYVLKLYAINKYGVKSNTITIPFSVAAPFWKTIWFYLLLFIGALISVIVFFNWRNKKTKLRLEEKNRFQKQFAALEQQALQTQMNPHFIFNCLNSIQQYILTNDKEKANQYLTGFAALIRQTLDISAEKSITVADEASYLKKYLEMEHMRYGDTFTYSINVGDNADYIKMPALLLQPYVENSLRHGIRYKEDGTGKVEISFIEKENHLLCTIKDNGVGREKAAEFKGKQHIEYQSKGMSLTSKRIELLNTINESKITIAVVDLKNEDNTAAGTLVEINLPI